ncbi:MAG: hypothetical protein WCE81_00750 [Halobacteriota archaeon]
MLWSFGMNASTKVYDTCTTESIGEKQLLGHSNIQTTTVYLQFRDQDLRDVYNKVKF